MSWSFQQLTTANTLHRRDWKYPARLFRALLLLLFFFFRNSPHLVGQSTRARARKIDALSRFLFDFDKQWLVVLLSTLAILLPFSILRKRNGSPCFFSRTLAKVTGKPGTRLKKYERWKSWNVFRACGFKNSGSLSQP